MVEYLADRTTSTANDGSLLVAVQRRDWRESSNSAETTGATSNIWLWLSKPMGSHFGFFGAPFQNLF